MGFIYLFGSIFCAMLAVFFAAMYLYEEREETPVLPIYMLSIDKNIIDARTIVGIRHGLNDGYIDYGNNDKFGHYTLIFPLEQLNKVKQDYAIIMDKITRNHKN